MLLAAAVVAMLTACVAGEAATPRIAVAAPPKVLRVGQPWHASVQVRNGRPEAFVIRKGRRVGLFPLLPSRRGYRASVVFPAAGRWRYGVRLRKRDHFVDSVGVRGQAPALRMPFGIVEEARGTLLVADFPQSAVFRLRPATGEGRILARVEAPRDLRASPDGKVLVSSGSRVLELDPATGVARVRARASAGLEGVAPGPDGSVYAVEEQARIVRLGADGSRSVLADGLSGVHGILPTADGLVLCESYAGNVRMLAADGGLRTVASGLGNPSYAAPGPDGAVYVTEFSANRLSLVDRSGSVRQVAPVGSPGPVALDHRGRLLVGSIDGRIRRIDPATGRATLVWPPAR